MPNEETTKNIQIPSEHKTRETRNGNGQVCLLQVPELQEISSSIPKKRRLNTGCEHSFAIRVTGYVVDINRREEHAQKKLDTEHALMCKNHPDDSLLVCKKCSFAHRIGEKKKLEEELKKQGLTSAEVLEVLERVKKRLGEGKWL